MKWMILFALLVSGCAEDRIIIRPTPTLPELDMVPKVWDDQKGALLIEGLPGLMKWTGIGNCKHEELRVREAETGKIYYVCVTER